MKELLELIKNGSISYLGNTRGINENDCKKIDFSSCNNFQKWYYKNIEIAVVYESTYKC